MERRKVTHPLRQAWINQLTLVGQNEVDIEIHYTVETDTRITWHTQTIRLSLCNAKNVVRQLHRIGGELQQQLDSFRAGLRGEQ